MIPSRSAVVLHVGDCLDSVRNLPDTSIDSIVTDPPYALVSIGKRFGKEGAAPAQHGSDGLYARASRGFMGKTWDTGERAFAVEFWAECLRVLKPGGHVAAFSGTRTYHRLACAIEDAGFEIRDQLAWTYGTGFPKSHDVSKGIDKAAGAERQVVGNTGRDPLRMVRFKEQDGCKRAPTNENITAPATEAARRWQGWGTALKPAWEPIALARKPLAGTVAETVLAHGTGALNIDGCRIPTDETINATRNIALGSSSGNVFGRAAVPGVYVQKPEGRWPANLVHDGSDEVLACFPISAARFFYCAKASAADRAGSKHPTVKPVALMRWLVRLITPPGGVVLDPFAGTGTTGQAAREEGFTAMLCEREEEYVSDITRRLTLYGSGPGRFDELGLFG